MARLASYYVPGVYVEDHSIEVPVDWRGCDPAELARGSAPDEVTSGRRMSLFYRTVCAPDRIHDDLPLLIYLQGGPGGEAARPWSASSPGWFVEALKHYRIVLPDQRGTGRSSRVDGRTMERLGDARAGADLLKCLLADSIVRDFEYLRLVAFPGKRWTTIGVSYGGFLTLTYLSLYPEGVAASFAYAGMPELEPSPDSVYRHTFPRMEDRSRAYYRRYPCDEERVAALADFLAEHDVRLADGSAFTPRRLQLLGSGFGMSGGYESLHWLLDQAFSAGDGTLAAAEAAGGLELSEGFLLGVLNRTTSAASPLYWPLQEFIFCNGEVEPCRWAAERAYRERPAFSSDARPLLFTGEAMFPWMFETDPALAPFKPAMDLLMEETRFGRIYDAERLASNEVPLYAAIYHDDLYVPAETQLETLARVGNSHRWVQSDFAHDGITAPQVFEHMFAEALGAGDLEGAL